MPVRRIATIAVLLVSLCACGGGGSGGDPGPVFAPANAFVGAWHVVGVKGDAPTLLSAWGTATVAADGEMTLALETNEDGVLDVDGGTLPTRVVAGGTLDWLNGALVIWSGGIAAAGDVAIVTTANDGSVPYLFVLFRAGGGGFTNADLNGSYHVVRMRRDIGTPATAAWWSHGIAFDGVGTASDVGPTNKNTEGVVSGTGFGSAPYNVDGDGFIESANTEGGVLPGGAAVMQGGRITTNDPLINLYVPHSAAATNASFSGTYAMVGMQYDATTPAYRSTNAVLTASGAGTGNVTGRQNVNGIPAPLPVPAAVTYSVEADGKVTLALPDGSEVEGAVSPDGRIVILGGSTTPGADPAIFVLVRLN